MKLLLTVFIFSISINIYSFDTQIVSKSNEYSGVTELYIYDVGESKEINRKVVYYDKLNSIKKVEVELSDESIKSSKIIKQIEYYDSKTIVKYELLHSKDYVIKTGVDKTVEYMGKNDTVIKTEYYCENKLIFSENIDSFSGKFKISLINNYDKFIRETYNQSKNDIPKGDHIVYEAKTFKCKTVVTYLNQQTDIEDNEKSVLNGYLKMRSNNEMAKLYSKKFLVSESDKIYWILVQDEVLKHIKKDQKMLFMYYYIGGYNENVVIMGIDFYDL